MYAAVADLVRQRPFFGCLTDVERAVGRFPLSIREFRKHMPARPLSAADDPGGALGAMLLADDLRTRMCDSRRSQIEAAIMAAAAEEGKVVVPDAVCRRQLEHGAVYVEHRVRSPGRHIRRPRESGPVPESVFVVIRGLPLEDLPLPEPLRDLVVAYAVRGALACAFGSLDFCAWSFRAGLLSATRRPHVAAIVERAIKEQSVALLRLLAAARVEPVLVRELHGGHIACDARRFAQPGKTEVEAELVSVWGASACPDGAHDQQSGSAMFTSGWVSTSRRPCS